MAEGSRSNLPAPSLRRQFLLFYIPSIVVAGLLLVLFHTIKTESTYNTLREHEMGHVGHGQEVITTEFQNAASDLILLTNSQIQKNYLANPSASTMQLLADEYLLLANSKKTYEKIRFLDTDGREVIRANFRQGTPSLAGQDQLQHKGKRYYFADIFNLKTGEIYVSPMDLNVEDDRVEQPFKPIIRFGVPLIDATGKKHGVVVFNYLGDVLLKRLEKIMSDTATDHPHLPTPFLTSPLAKEQHLANGRPILLNQQGYWLHGSGKDKEWGFVLLGRGSFAKDYPEEWQTISSREHGQFLSPNGMFTFSTIYPLQHGFVSTGGAPDVTGVSAEIFSGKEYSWKLLSFIDQEQINALNRHHLQVTTVFYLAILLLLLPLCQWLARMRQQKLLAEAEVLQAKLDWERTFDAVPDLIALLDRQFHITRVNRSMSEVLGLPPEQCIGKTCHSTIHNSLEPIPTCPHAKMLRDGTMQSAEVEEINLGGFYQVTASPLFDSGGNLTGGVHIARDITASKIAHLRIERLNLLRQGLLEEKNLSIKLQQITDGMLDIFNAALARIWLVAPADRCAACEYANTSETDCLCRQRTLCLHLAADSGNYPHGTGDQERVPFGCQAVGRIAAGKVAKILSNDLIDSPDATDHRWAAMRGFSAFAGYQLLGNDGTPLGVLALYSNRPITTHEDLLLDGLANTSAQIVNMARAKQELVNTKEMLQKIFDNVDAMVYITDLDTFEILMTNRYLRNIFGDIEGKRCWEAIQAGQSGPCEFCVINNQLPTEKREGATFVWLTQNTRTKRWYECHDTIIRWMDDRKVRLQIATDITERKEAEEKLKEYSVVQKTLLREVNHRVKNNLAAIIGMLHMEEDRARARQQNDYTASLQDVIARINGLSTVHSLLSAGEWRPLPLDHLCEEIARSALHGVPLDKEITLTVYPTSFKVASSVAHHLALVINELTTNSIKHALHDRNHARIEISFFEEENRAGICFSDDGPGYPEPFTRGDLSSANIGMIIINGVVTSTLQGTLSLGSQGGATTCFTFKNNQEHAA